MFALCRNEGRLLGRVARSFSSKQEVFDRSNLSLLPAQRVDAVIAHRDRIALRQDMSDYGYFRKDTIEEITDRLLVFMLCCSDNVGHQPQVPCRHRLGLLGWSIRKRPAWSRRRPADLRVRFVLFPLSNVFILVEMLKLARKNNDAHADPACIFAPSFPCSAKAVCSDQRRVLTVQKHILPHPSGIPFTATKWPIWWCLPSSSIGRTTSNRRFARCIASSFPTASLLAPCSPVTH